MLDYWKSVHIPGVQHPLGLPISEEQDWTDPAGKKFVIPGFRTRRPGLRCLYC
jgi:hypothetical protein